MVLSRYSICHCRSVAAKCSILGVRKIYSSGIILQLKKTSIDFEKKRKYELIKTQRLNEIKQSLPQDRVYNDANRITRCLKIGLFTIIIFFGSATLYAGIFRRSDLKTWLDERRGVKTSKKEEGVIPAEYFEKEEERLNRKNAKVDNPNDSAEPGVYICGNNGSSLVCDNGRRKFQTVMKRLKIFDHKYARYVALGSKSGVLIDDNGDLFQWGDGFGGNSAKASLKGQNLVKACISHGAIYALSKNGQVIYMPESIEGQSHFKRTKKGWFGNSEVKFCKLNTTGQIKDIAAGKYHLVLLSNDGKVYTSATGCGEQIPSSWGQFGLPNLSQFDAPPENNKIYEVTLLNKYIDGKHVKSRKITKIAAGDYFTMCLDSTGRIWEFGKNTYGSIGTQMDYNAEVISFPSPVKLISNYFRRDELPKCVDIAAGGQTAFATCTSSNIFNLFENSLEKGGNFNMDEIMGNSTDKLLHLSWGYGLKGELGTGRYVHGQFEPSKIKVLNNIQQYNEDKQEIENIGVKNWSVGGNHVVVMLNNMDVYVWGDNEYGQLGNGKKSRSAVPIAPPSLLEPGNHVKKALSKTEQANNRLQLKKTNRYEQVITAGPDTTAIYYKKLT